MSDEPYITATALAAYSTLSSRQLRRLATDPVHPLPAHRVGDRWLFRRSEFDAWVRERDAQRVPTRALQIALAIRGRR